MKKTFRLIGGCLALFSPMLCAGTASALGDGKDYPALICEKDTARGIRARWAGTVSNTSTTEGLDLVCPFVRDSSWIESAFIQMFARSTIQDGFPGCEIHSELISGTSVFGSSEWEVTPLVNSPDVQTISYGTLSGGDNYYAVCFIPRVTVNGYSHLGRLFVGEQ